MHTSCKDEATKRKHEEQHEEPECVGDDHVPPHRPDHLKQR